MLLKVSGYVHLVEELTVSSSALLLGELSLLCHNTQ